MRNKLLIGSGLVAIIIALLMTFFNPFQDDVEASQPFQNKVDVSATQEAFSFEGNWSAELENGKMLATVTANAIEIHWDLEDDTSALYWKGSFSVPAGVTESSKFTVTSAGEVSTMETSMLASQDSSKTFTYDGKTLNYKLKIMGVTKTIRLSK
jgi:hypothetical protein